MGPECNTAILQGIIHGFPVKIILARQKADGCTRKVVLWYCCDLDKIIRIERSGLRHYEFPCMPFPLTYKSFTADFNSDAPDQGDYFWKYRFIQPTLAGGLIIPIKKARNHRAFRVLNKQILRLADLFNQGCL